MSSVKDVLVKYHKIVPFPWTIRKIKKAGKNPTSLILEIGREIAACENAETDAAKQLIELLAELEMML